MFLSCCDIIIETATTAIPTLSTAATPHPPASVEQTSQGLTSVQIQWTAVSQNNTLFHIKLYCMSSCADNVTKNFTTMDTSITVYGLKPDEIYTVQVAVLTDNTLASEYSEPLQVSTATSGKQIVFSRPY